MQDQTTTLRRALFLITYTPNNEVFWGSLACIGGWTVVPYHYDNLPYDRHLEFVELAKSVAPDVIICVGALDEGPSRSKPIPRPHILRKFRDIAPSILLCGDVADNAWYSTLHEYERHECFDLGVSMDGADWPGFLTKLTPVDSSVYKPLPWQERDVPIGRTGGQGDERIAVINALNATWCGPSVPNWKMAEFMCRCRVILNTPRNGSGNADHVKGRVIETGYAGACLLERNNGATARWFVPDVDYVGYDSPGDAIAKANWISVHEDEARKIAENLHAKVTIEHSPQVFWRDVLERVNL